MYKNIYDVIIPTSSTIARRPGPLDPRDSSPTVPSPSNGCIWREVFGRSDGDGQSEW